MKALSHRPLDSRKRQLRDAIHSRVDADEGRQLVDCSFAREVFATMAQQITNWALDQNT